MTTMTPARALSATGLAATVLLGTAGAAAAHVHVDPESTSAEGYSVLNFRVPNEEEKADTTTVTVTLPQDHPLTSVSVRPVPGWKATTATAKLPKPVTREGATITEAVRTVTWKATGSAAIAPHQFQVFSLSVGPLPASGTTMRFPTEQTYTGGKVVRWNQTQKGSTEPEYPSPEFEVTAAEPESGSSPTVSATPASQAEGRQQQSSSTGSQGSDSTARWLGGAGLAVGLLGLLVAAVTLLAARRGGGAR